MKALKKRRTRKTNVIAKCCELKKCFPIVVFYWSFLFLHYWFGANNFMSSFEDNDDYQIQFINKNVPMSQKDDSNKTNKSMPLLHGDEKIIELVAKDLSLSRRGDDITDNYHFVDENKSRQYHGDSFGDRILLVGIKNSTTDTSNLTNAATIASSMIQEKPLQPSATSPFQRYDGVVIVSKVLWDKDIDVICQFICYISHAYNDQMHYDIIIFTTIPWSEKSIRMAQKAAGNSTKLTVVVERPSLDERLEYMSDEEVKYLRERCNERDPNRKLSWFHYCSEVGSKTKTVNLGYAWQSEFRSYHIWNHDALQDYKYMMWFDIDCRLKETWTQDPMQMFIENNLTLMYNGFPYGQLEDNLLRSKMRDVYNVTICYNDQSPAGHMYGKMCEERGPVKMIAGAHHITNLEDYRKEIHQTFLKSLVGDYPYMRKFDDQLAVTIVAVMERYLRHQGGEMNENIWHQRKKNLTLNVYHHGMFDVSPKLLGKVNKWNYFHSVKEEWPGLADRCGEFVTKK